MKNLGNGEYILEANLRVAELATLEMTSNSDELQYLQIADENGIMVYGKIAINGINITSWDVSDDDIVQQNIMVLSHVVMCNLLQVKVLKY